MSELKDKRRSNRFISRIFLPSEEIQSLNARIKVLGVGGGGSNAVDRMVGERIEGVEFFVSNTDVQALNRSVVKKKIQFGAELTKGLGAGANPAIGRNAAMEDKEKFIDHLAEADMLFITAGMGGGTGTGAAPVISKAVKEANQEILVVGVVTTPFLFERKKRMECALKGLRELKQTVDSLITIPNEKILKEGELSLKDAYEKVNDVLYNAVQGISDLIMRPGYINVDFADVKAVMSVSGTAVMGTGRASGEDRAKEAARRAIENPLLEDIDVYNARGLLVNVTANSSMPVSDFMTVQQTVTDIASEDATVIAGQIFDDSVGEEMRVTLVATGLRDAYDEFLEDEPTSPVYEYEDQQPADHSVFPDISRFEGDEANPQSVIPSVFRNHSSMRQSSTISKQGRGAARGRETASNVRSIFHQGHSE